MDTAGCLLVTPSEGRDYKNIDIAIECNDVSLIQFTGSKAIPGVQPDNVEPLHDLVRLMLALTRHLEFLI